MNKPLDDSADPVDLLDRLIGELASGAHQQLETRAEDLLGPVVESLQKLREAARGGLAPPETPIRLAQIWARLDTIRQMLSHAVQVQTGLTGILGLIYAAGIGSQYSARGEPALPNTPRLVTEA